MELMQEFQYTTEYEKTINELMSHLTATEAKIEFLRGKLGFSETRSSSGSINEAQILNSLMHSYAYHYL